MSAFPRREGVPTQSVGTREQAWEGGRSHADEGDLPTDVGRLPSPGQGPKSE